MNPATISSAEADTRALAKSPTGIHGLDEITGGGLPRGRPTLISGTAGCGKTLMAMEFLVRGATQFGEAGVFMAFEERPDELNENVRSLGFALEDLEAQNLLVIDHVHLERSEIDETGEYDLEGLFIRLGHAIDSVGAKRVVLDTIETLFAGLSDHAILRAELRRLFRWLKDKGVSAIITCERGEGALTRHGLEEYVSDCVILLDHRVTDQLSTRRLRVVKYRGSAHGTDEYPFIIDEHGIVVLPITSAGLEHQATNERVSSGIPRLDAMLGGEGFFRGSTILVSGTAGTGKTSMAAHFARASCQRAERALFVAFEESPSQILRNARSIGIDLEPYVRQGLLRFHAARPTVQGLEMHLVAIHKQVAEFRPSAVIVDPITNLSSAGTTSTANSMLLRVIDHLKNAQITAFFTALSTNDGSSLETTDVGVSSIVDTWMLLRDVELNGERNRCAYVLKSRGMPHSNQLREFVLTDHGIELLDVYVGPGGVLTGSSRLAQQAREKAEALMRDQAIERRRRELERKRMEVQARIAALQAEFQADEDELERVITQERAIRDRLANDRTEMARSRKADDNGEERAHDRAGGA
jgi:circadian clock protein KaiC